MLEILGDGLKNIINKYLDLNRLFELRLRAGCPVTVNYGGEYLFLTENGTSRYPNNSVKLSYKDIESLVLKASNYSVYSVSDQLKQGFITTKGGVRLGVAGECVFEGDRIATIKNISSITLRIPHEIKGSANKVLEYALDGELKNTLIISPPGYGKTTILRDLSRQISDKTLKNILIIDERNEISSSGEAPSLDVGKTADVLRFCDKAYAFTMGIRALKPDVIITDELSGQRDWTCVKESALCGVKIMASAHSDSLESLLKGGNFIGGVFDRYVILSLELGMGTVSRIYDGEYNSVYELN